MRKMPEELFPYRDRLAKVGPKLKESYNTHKERRKILPHELPSTYVGKFGGSCGERVCRNFIIWEMNALHMPSRYSV